MRLFAILLAALCGCLSATSGADARPVYADVPDAAPMSWQFEEGRSAVAEEGSSRRSHSQTRSHRAKRAAFKQASFDIGSHTGVGPRPSAWCGWWMRTQLGGGPEYNLAWNWRHYGSAGSPQVGAVVVWRHHVGMIVGQSSNGQWIVKSGNDSHRVQARARSISGAVVRV